MKSTNICEDSLGKTLGIDDKIRRHNVKKGTLKYLSKKMM
jgi:hypothetical protein